MGDHGGLKARAKLALGLAVLVLATVASACRSHDVVEERRALLKPVQVQHDLEEQRRKLQVFDTDGTLLPSDQIVAGMVLPRGLRLYGSSEHDWDFIADHVPAKTLEGYFSARLIQQSGVTHSQGGAVDFQLAQPKDDMHAPRVSVRIVALRGALDASELFIHQTVPGKIVPPEATVEAQMKALREHAM